jgi:hypothetical protein
MDPGKNNFFVETNLFNPLDMARYVGYLGDIFYWLLIGDILICVARNPGIGDLLVSNLGPKARGFSKRIDCS